MNGSSRKSMRTTAGLTVSGAASVLLLGMRVEADQIGRTSTVRVFLVAAIALIALAAPSKRGSRAFIGAAITMLVMTLALRLGDRAPQGLVVMLIAIASLVAVLRSPNHATN